MFLPLPADSAAADNGPVEAFSALALSHCLVINSPQVTCVCVSLFSSLLPSCFLVFLLLQPERGAEKVRAVHFARARNTNSSTSSSSLSYHLRRSKQGGCLVRPLEESYIEPSSVLVPALVPVEVRASETSASLL